MIRRRCRLAALVVFGLFAAAPGSAAPVVAGFDRFHLAADTPPGLIDGGQLLLNELNCIACHAAPSGWREQLPGRGKIDLAGVGSRLSAEALRAFIAAPHTFKAGTTMPALVRDEAGAAEAIAAYLATMTAVPKTFPAGDATRGQKLFHSVGCVSCHAPADVATQQASVPIALASHYERNALAAFLQNPLRTRPAGRMPAIELSDAEAADLAAYLVGPDLRAGRPAPVEHAGESKVSAPAERVTRGRALFASQGCAACHNTADSAPATAVKPLAQLRPDAGCLAPNPAAGVPNFSLSAAQSRALVAGLRHVQATSVPAPLTAEQRVAKKFEQLNCYACHEWRGRGGLEAARAKFFTATDAAVESLGEIGHIPPKLDQAGRKLTAAWLEKLFWGHGGGVRPYMAARMPRYGEAAAGDLVGLLAEACRPATPQEIDVSGGRGHQRFATGRTLLGAGTGGLGCVACHGIKGREPAGVRAINLTHTAQRLRPEYFKALLLDPQGLQPGTIMPPLFAGRKGADNEIESIWTYFKELDQSEVLPEGLALAGSFELKPQDEGRPIVFRTFLEGAGTQAIAVGFPAGVHVAFDAFEVRWALVWRGRYLDALTNWEERPMKPIKPLGEPKRSLATHMPFAALRNPGEPWPTKFGTYAEFIFKGYRLGPDGTPTFRYAVGGLEVEDTLRPASDGGSLRRTLVVRRRAGDDATWYFRGLGGGVTPQLITWQNGTAILEEEISP